jgi:hypothetical protein
MVEKSSKNTKVFLVLALIFVLTILLQIFFGFGLFAPGANPSIGYFIGISGFVLFFLIYAILKKVK